LQSKGLIPFAQPNVLVVGHEGTATLHGYSGVICYRELYIGQVFMKYPVFKKSFRITSGCNLKYEISLVGRNHK
jgi:hypothetical protein